MYYIVVERIRVDCILQHTHIVGYTVVSSVEDVMETRRLTF
jgi:hypothetical protein